MKKEYKNPSLEITDLILSDIVATSNHEWGLGMIDPGGVIEPIE